MSDMLPNPVKNIMFDLGGVLFDLDYDLSVFAFERLGVKDHATMFSDSGQLALFDRFEKGTVTTREFLSGMRDIIPAEADDETIIHAWNAMLIGFPQSSIDLLKNLHPHYNLYVLSNTNELHYRRFLEMLLERHGLSGLEGLFSAVYYSHLEGLRKPEAAFYKLLLEREKLDPGNTVFIDDRKANIDGALAVGIPAYLLNPNRPVTDMFGADFTFRG